MNRITNAMLDARVATINRMLGFGDEPAYSTVGAIVLEGAYGSTAVAQYCNKSGGVRMLHDYGTKREAYVFLNGMIQASRALDFARSV